MTESMKVDDLQQDIDQICKIGAHPFEMWPPLDPKYQQQQKFKYFVKERKLRAVQSTSFLFFLQ